MSENVMPHYLSIYHTLLERIENGIYKPSEKLPAEKHLTQEFGVSLITVKKALDLLLSDGLIYKIQGKGSFVTASGGVQPVSAPTEKPSSSKIIGIIMDDFLAGFGAGIVTGMENEAERLGYKIVPLRSGGDQRRESEAIDTLLQIGAEGLVVTPVHGEYYNKKIVKLALDGYPIVFLDRRLSGIPASFIASDNRGAAINAMQFLFHEGHRKILIISPVNNANSLSERLKGAEEALANMSSKDGFYLENLNISFARDTGDDSENAENGIQQIISALKTTECTAIFCLQYKLALMTQLAIRLEGKSIPNDFSVVCFDENYDVDGCQFFTHIRQEEESMGKQAVLLTLKKHENPNSVPENILLDTQLIVCSSTKKIKY